MGYEASNAVIGKSNRLKRAAIPFTITTAADMANAVAVVDGEFAGNAEIFLAGANGAANAPARGGAAGAAVVSTSAIDPSAVVPDLAADQATTTLGFVVLDGPSEKAPSTLPLVGDGKNPSYGTPAGIGNAKKLYEAFALITEGSVSSVIPGTIASATAADRAAAVTANGNLMVKVTFPLFMPISAAANLAPIQKVAGQTIKGILHLAWF